MPIHSSITREAITLHRIKKSIVEFCKKEDLVLSQDTLKWCDICLRHEQIHLKIYEKCRTEINLQGYQVQISRKGKEARISSIQIDFDDLLEKPLLKKIFKALFYETLNLGLDLLYQFFVLPHKHYQRKKVIKMYVQEYGKALLEIHDIFKSRKKKRRTI